MARPQILIVAVLLTVYVASTKATSLIPENGQWEQNPEAEMKLWKCVKKWSNYCLNKYGCHNKQGCLQNINSNVQKCVVFYNERCFAAQPGYSPCDDSSWIQPVSSGPVQPHVRLTCDISDCENGGTCLEGGNCLCPEEYDGDFCQTPWKLV